MTDVAEFQRIYEAGAYCHLGDNPVFSLLEFAWQVKRYPADVPELIRWLIEHGTRRIIAHPERYGFFRENPDWLRAIADGGAWLQITVDSLLGNHGVDPQTAGWDLLGTYKEAVLATDAHRPSRCSGLSIGYKWVGERLGAARADDLLDRADQILKRLLAQSD